MVIVAIIITLIIIIIGQLLLCNAKCSSIVSFGAKFVLGAMPFSPTKESTKILVAQNFGTFH
jgi:hypothetical protein